MFKVLVDGCDPTRGSKFSAAVDLYASEDMVIGAGETKIIGLGVEIEIKENMYIFFANSKTNWDKFASSHYLQLNPRSSLRAKGLISHTGIIDMDYNKEIKIIIHNPTIVRNKTFNGVEDRTQFEVALQNSFTIKKGEKIAQITLIEHKSYLMGVESKEERLGGFGSTDEKEKEK